MNRKDRMPETLDVLETTPENINFSSVSATTAALPPGSRPNRFTTDASNLPVFLNQAEDNPESCSSMFSSFQQRYSLFLKFAPTRTIKTYEDIVKEIFMNGTFDYRSKENYNQCLKEEKKFPTQKHMDISKRVEDIALNMAQSEVISEALVYAQQIADNYLDLRDTMLDCNDYISKINEYCYWFSDICQEEMNFFAKAQTEMSEALGYTDKVIRWFYKMGNHYDTLYKNYNENILPTLTKAEDYLMGNITKKKLHRLLEETTFTMGKEDLLDFNADLSEDIKYFIENVQYTKESMVKAYKQLVQLKIPILTPYNVYDLLMVQSVKDVNDARMQEILDSLKHDLDPGLTNLVKITFQRILDSVKEVKEGIIEPMEDLIEEIKALRKSLREYEESTIIDSNFFM